MNTVNELIEKVSNYEDLVLHVNVHCDDCFKINKNVTLIYANDLLHGNFNDYDFDQYFNFFCKYCKNTKRLKISNIRSILPKSTIYDYVRHYSKGNNNIKNFQLWDNSITKKKEIINPETTVTTFSKPERILFIPLKYANNYTVKDFQNIFDQFKENLKGEESHYIILKFFTTMKINYLIPMSINLVQDYLSGLIFNTDTLTFTLADNVPRAMCVTLGNDLYSKDLFYDPFNSNNDLIKDNYFNNYYEVIVEEIGKLEFEGNIKPRIFYKIRKSDNPELEGKFLQLRFNAKLQQYVFEHLWNELPYSSKRFLEIKGTYTQAKK